MTISPLDSDALHSLQAQFTQATQRLEQEIVRHQETEAALKESEQRYRALFDAAQRQAQELTLLDQVRTALAKELDLPALLRTVVEAITETFGYTLVSLYLREGATLRLQHQVGYAHVIAEIPVTQGVVGKVMRTGQPVLVEDVRADPDFLGAVEGVVSEVCVPLFDAGQAVGVLNIESTQGVRLTPGDLRLMTMLSQQVSVALGRARIYAELAHERDLLQALLANIPDIIYFKDTASRFTRINPAQAKVLGVSDPAQAVGQRDLDLQPGELAETFYAEEQHILNTDESLVDREEYNPTPDGQPRWFSATKVPLQDKEGRIVGLVGISRDITERKRAAETREILFTASQQIAVSLDPEQVYAAIHRATVQLMPMDIIVITVLDEARQEVEVVYLVDQGGRAQPARFPATQGLTGQLLATGQALRVGDITATNLHPVHLGDPNIPRSVLAVPLRQGDKTLGMLSAQSYRVGIYSADDERILLTLANQAASAIANARLYHETRRMADRQTILYETLRAVGGQLDPDVIARAAVDAITRQSRWRSVAISMPNPGGQMWTTRAGGGDLVGEFGVSRPMERGVIGRAYRTGRTQSVPDVSADPDYFTGGALAIQSELAVPLTRASPGTGAGKRGPQMLGVLNVESDQLNAFSAEDVSLAESLADAVALALENARLYAAAQQEIAERKRAEAELLEREHYLTLLNDITRASIEIEDFKVMLQTLANQLGGLINADDCYLTLWDESTGRTIPAAASGAERATYPLLRLSPDEPTVTAAALNQERAIIIPDVFNSAYISPDRIKRFSARSMLGLPLIASGQKLGAVLVSFNQPHHFTPEEIAHSEQAAAQIALAVSKTQLYQSVVDARGRLEALIKASRDGIILIGLDRRVLVCNMAALELIRIPGQPEDWLNRPLSEALSALRHFAPSVVRMTLTEMRRIERGDESPGEGEYEIPPRVIRWLNLPVLAGAAPLGRLLVLRDVTEERLLERMREDLTYTMVHDLRNPLGGIRTSLLMLAEEAASLAAPQQRVLNIALHSTDHMLELVNAILDVSRLESGQMPLELQPLALSEIVAEVLQIESALAAKKNIRLETALPGPLPRAQADPNLLRRILQNLVGNAIKFTPAAGVVRVSAEAGAAPSLLRVRVSDSGPGIPLELQSRLFQKFVTGRVTERGSGLGLAFCRLAVEAHGGRIWVESEPGHGTAFIFTLPIEKHNDAHD